MATIACSDFSHLDKVNQNAGQYMGGDTVVCTESSFGVETGKTAATSSTALCLINGQIFYRFAPGNSAEHQRAQHRYGIWRCRIEMPGNFAGGEQTGDRSA